MSKVNNANKPYVSKMNYQLKGLISETKAIYKGTVTAT
jgi:hypothetical protein